MSNEMIERVARAAEAKAAISAMREPTEEMKKAGNLSDNMVVGVWEDMIDAALKED